VDSTALDGGAPDRGDGGGGEPATATPAESIRSVNVKSTLFDTL